MHNQVYFPIITFSVIKNCITIMLQYRDNIKVTISDHTWSVHDSQATIMEYYTYINSTLSNFLYLDFIDNPDVDDFLNSGPPGDGGNTVESVITNILKTTKTKYYEFVKLL